MMTDDLYLRSILGILLGLRSYLEGRQAEISTRTEDLTEKIEWLGGYIDGLTADHQA